MSRSIRRPKYENRFVCFLDLLGFSKLVASGESEVVRTIAAAALDEFVLIQEEALREAPNIMGEAKPRENIVRASFFSDTIVLSGDGDDMGFAAVRWACVKLHDRLLRKRQLIRGGISFGPVHHDPDTGVIFGPALLEAYRIESTVAAYPRVVLDEKAIVEIERICEDRIDDLFDEMTCMDSDDQRFLSLLRFGYVEFYSNNQRMFYKRDLPSFITKQIGFHGRESGIKAKYEWLANEFNRVLVGKYSDFGEPIALGASKDRAAPS